MFDIKWIRDHPEAFDEGRRVRGLDPLSTVLADLDDRRKAAIARLQAVQERRNTIAKEIGRAMARKDVAEAERLKAEVVELKIETPAREAEERDSSAALTVALSEIPNIPLDDVPIGRDEHDNHEVKRSGQRPAFPDGVEPKEHFTLGEALGQMDFETAAKLSGARFVVLRGGLARLHRALGQYMLDLHVDRHGYEEVDPPILVRATPRCSAPHNCRSSVRTSFVSAMNSGSFRRPRCHSPTSCASACWKSANFRSASRP